MKNLGLVEEKMMEMKAEISKLTAEGSSGAGLVRVILNGDYHVQKISINPVIIDKKEQDMMEVLIQSAFNDAAYKIKQLAEDYARREIRKSGILKEDQN